MQKFTTTTRALAALLVSGTALSSVASAAMKFQVMSVRRRSYIWRGNTQAGDDASLSSGDDIDFGNGFAVGAPFSSLGGGGDNGADANYEQDLYASYSTEIAGYPLEVGYISYMYPGAADSTLNFADFYVSTSVAGIGLSYYMLASARR